MRTDGIFIGIEVDDEALEAQPALARHLDTVCRRIGVNDRTSAALWARDHLPEVMS